MQCCGHVHIQWGWADDVGLGSLGVDTNSAVLVRSCFVIVVFAPLGELISVQVGASSLAHYSHRIHLGFLNGRGQGRLLFVWEGSG